VDPTILWVSSTQTFHNYGVKKHKHNYYHLFYLTRGEAVFSVDGTETLVKAGQMVFAPKGVIHGYEKIECPIMESYQIKFVVFDVGLNTVLSRVKPFLDGDNFSTSVIRQIVAESTQLNPATQSSIRSYLLSLLYYMTAPYRRGDDSESQVIDTTGFSPVSKKIVDFLEGHYMEDVSLQAIADCVGFNKNYICSVFKHDSRLTIGECLNLIRIRKAAELISYSDMDLSQVYSATGFANLSHFNRIFKKITGIPPGQYRKMYPLEVLLEGDLEVPAEYQQNQDFIVSVVAGQKISAENAFYYLNQKR
jgi:AraC-like DNA-binding protein